MDSRVAEVDREPADVESTSHLLSIIVASTTWVMPTAEYLLLNLGVAEPSPVQMPPGDIRRP